MKILKVIVKKNLNHVCCTLVCKSNIYGFCCVPVVHEITGLTGHREGSLTTSTDKSPDRVKKKKMKNEAI